MNSLPLPHNRIEVLLRPGALREGLIRDVASGFGASPKRLPPKYFYDDRGSGLFEDVTRLPEYYLTRAERALLEAHASEIAQAADARVLLELGSGSSAKTRLLLDAMAVDGLAAYVPVDVSEGALQGALADLAADYPALPTHGVVADFEDRLVDLPSPGRRLFAFLGSTIGNFAPPERADFLDRLADAMAPGETLLLGTDLVKDPARLVRAYDDAAGVTAEFNLNVIHVLNRELDGDLDPGDFRHRAVWDADREWMEMSLRALRPVSARLQAIGLDVEFAEGEEVRTEISAKFRKDRVTTELKEAGLELEAWWTDGDFALSLARRV
ncbi:L-histidine N(alpha)-methyltransferase [Salininema proteolyticum]|uniref:L-histidine N(Alpha)-methyltransferase n=1 Tax=Salininema proteolyticum TaxID=1607685 RepID=A0ABV8TUE7_9ACTN